MTRHAIILLGGKGTRIQSLYGDRPKCLVPVSGKPILLWQLEWLQRGGIRRVHLAAGFMADVLRDWLKTDAPADMEITFSVEPEPLGTGGAIQFAEPWIQSDPFFVLNGDSLTPNLDFQALDLRCSESAFRIPEKKRSKGERQIYASKGSKSAQNVPTIEKNAVIAIAQIEKTGRYGTVEFDENQHVTAFLEKAEREQGWINTGVYCISRSTLDSIEPNKNLSIETELFPSLAAEGCLHVFPCDPPLLDMGTPDGLAAMECFLKTRA